MKTQENIITDSNGVRWVQDHFIYVAKVPTPLLLTSSQSVSIPIEADSDFIWVKSSYFTQLSLGASILESTRAIPMISVAINDSGSGRNLQNVAVPIENLCGFEGLPMVNPIPRTFKASANINVTFTNYGTATSYDAVFLSLIGYKRFKL